MNKLIIYVTNDFYTKIFILAKRKQTIGNGYQWHTHTRGGGGLLRT